MKSFNYFSPKTVNEALDILKDASEDTHIIAGGTDIMLNLHSGKTEPEEVVNINGIDQLKYIKDEDGLIRIGALVNFGNLIKNELLRQNVKILVDACKEIGSVQIRNLGTIGGNIVTGSPAADSVAALVALDATVVLEDNSNKREIKIADFYDEGKPKINKNQVLTEVFFQKPNGNTRTAFTRLIKRKAVDIVVLSMGAVIEKDNENKCIRAQFSLGAVARNPIRLYKIEEKLIGKDINKENLEGLMDEMSDTIYNTILEGSPWREDSAFYKSKSIRGIAGKTFDSILEDLSN